MAALQRVAFLVAHRLEELVDPDGGVHGQALAVQGVDLDGAGAWVQNGPEAGDTHGSWCGGVSLLVCRNRAGKFLTWLVYGFVAGEDTAGLEYYHVTDLI